MPCPRAGGAAPCCGWWDSSFEGDTQLGLGVRARLPFRVSTLQDAMTSRLVIDVAHRW
ncbi:hypothetical protein [Knoellia sp. p5-6-4]|uniref:AMIN-like domain-containing (lipo)protein n=1 Tax=unclassified Knoellia TaxID=2618719 RepID=UPI0023DB6DA6|nr:hypothetical protein [Knoellia sp. p5-6-4]MDF2144717.1 hypothetical protein [Knoellia sp. p5-6-4]